jgi:hypothetical protein
MTFTCHATGTVPSIPACASPPFRPPSASFAGEKRRKAVHICPRPNNSQTHANLTKTNCKVEGAVPRERENASAGSTHLARHVGAGVDASLWELPGLIVSNGSRRGGGVNLRKSNFESLLNRRQHLLVALGADKGDGETLGSKTTGTTNAVKVRVSIGWEIVVDGKVDTLDINTTTEDIGGHADSLVELLELLVALDTILPLAPHSYR